MCVLFYSLFACISAYANVIFKITIIKQNIQIIPIAGVPMSQAFPGYLITAPPSVCVPDVIGALAVWIQNQKKRKKRQARAGEVGIDHRALLDTLRASQSYSPCAMHTPPNLNFCTRSGP